MWGDLSLKMGYIGAVLGAIFVFGGMALPPESGVDPYAKLGASIADCYVDERMSVDLFYSVIGLDDRLSNGLRTLSGYSSSGTQTSIYVNLTQTATPSTVALQHLCVVECVSMLLVGQNRQITVIS